MNSLPKSNALSSSHVPSVSLFAQLLASERLTVRVDRSLTTAAFVPEQRILLLPSWSGFDEAAWLLFVAHEVGHALFTPSNALTSHPDWQRLVSAHGLNIVRNVTNVFEDIRIERLVREKYRGLSGTFGRGYHSLINRAFFGFAPSDLTADVWASKTTLDRLNIYAKAGALLRVSLSESQEIAWYNRALRLNTYEEVLSLVEEVILALNAQQKAQASQSQSGQLQGQPTQGQSSSQSQNGQSSQPQDGQSQSSQSQSQDGQSQSQSSQSQSSQSQPSQDGQSQDGQSQSSQSSSQDVNGSNTPQAGNGLEGSPNNAHAHGSNPFEVASQQAAEKSLHHAAKTGAYESAGTVLLPSNTSYLHHNDVSVEEMLTAWKASVGVRYLFRQSVASQRREQSSILASMIAAFRANQAAWQSRRVQVSKTGAIDTAKLAQYKLVDDLFLRRQSLPEAQNHGFVIHVDWSGSMETKMATVLWQVLHLIWFAESIKVPVSVYGFSNSGASTPAYDEYRKTCTGGSPFPSRLLELYRSNLPASVKQDAQAFLFALTMRFAGLPMLVRGVSEYGHAPTADLIKYHTQGRVPKSLMPTITSLLSSMTSLTYDELTTAFHHDYVSFGGTPLHQALFASVDTVRKFRQVHRIEQCISVWLTDGEDTDGLVGDDTSVTVPDPDGYRPYSYRQRVLDASSLIDPRSGRQFKVQHLLATMFDLHRTLTGATVVCIDITPVPLNSLRRVLTKGDLAVVANQVGDQSNEYYGRRRRGYVKPKTLTQNRKRVILPQSDGTFTETGLLLVTRKQYPQIGCDAYLVSHPDWWMNANTGASSITSAASDVLSRSNAVVEDDEFDAPMTEEEQAEAKLLAPVRLKAALLEQHATIAMRRFTDLLVPYMAAGREDASVR